MNSSAAGANSQADGADGEGDGEQTTNLAHTPTLHSKRIPTAPENDAIPSDGLGPHTFFTYEIVFVPDLTEKYVLEINGQPGEVRAAMNLVNGWQFTGLGPYYMKDSSTAQNSMARGVALNLGLGGAADVINSVANLKSLAGAGKPVDPSAIAAMAAELERAQQTAVFDVEALKDRWVEKTITYADGTVEKVMVPPTLERYAEIYVYEAVNEGGQMVWKPVANHCFDRQYLGVMRDGRLGGAGATSDPEFPTDPAVPSSAPGELPAPANATSQSVGPARGRSLFALAAEQALMNSALQAAGYAPVPPEHRDEASEGAQAMAENGTRLALVAPLYAPAVPEAQSPPPPLLDADANARAVGQALGPACAPCKKSWHDRLFPCKKPQYKSSEFNGVTAQ